MKRSSSSAGMVVMASSAVELTVLPQYGARFHRLRAFGHDVLRTPADPAEHERDPFYWGGYVMAPWCNRLAAEPTFVSGRQMSLSPNFRDGTAIHGQVYVRPWDQVDDAAFEIEGGADGWPWPYRVRLELNLADTALTAELAVTNLADEPMPAGAGLHPWFLKPLELAVHADSVFISNLDSSPQPQPVGAAHDLRRMAPMPADLDGTWSDLSEPPVELRWPAGGVAARLRGRSSSDFLFITAASPSNVDAVAVEPQTHAPQGVRRLLGGEPGALALLPPGQSLRLTSELTFSQTSGDDQT